MADDSLCAGCGSVLPLAGSSGLVTCEACGRQRRVQPPTARVAPLDDRRSDGDDPADPPPLGDPGPLGPDGGGWPKAPLVDPDPDEDHTIPPGGGPGFAGGASAGGPPTPGAKGGASKPRTIGCGCLPGLVVLVVLALIGVVVFRASDTVREAFDDLGDLASPGANVMAVAGTVTVLGSGDGGKVDLVAVVQDNTSSTRYLSRLQLGDDGVTARWRGPELPEDTYDAQVEVVGETIFAGYGDELVAVDARTGKELWTAPLADEITPNCDRCFATVDGTLVVRTTDATIAGFRAESSEARWERQLVSPQGSIAAVGSTLFVTDDAGESGDSATAVVDPASGAVLRTVTLNCPPTPESIFDLTLGSGDPIRAVPGSTDVVAVFGFVDACVVRWDPATGTVRYSQRVSEVGNIEGDEVVVGAADLVFAGSEDLVQVDLANGTSRRLALPADRTARPNRIVGRTLVANTLTTRGTTKGGLAAWNLDDGSQRWSITVPGDAEPVTTGDYGSSDALFDDQPRNLLVPVGDDGLNLFTFDGEDRSLRVDAVDLSTGELAEVDERPIPSDYDSGTLSLTVESVGRSRLLFSVGGLLSSMAVAGTGEVISFPTPD